MPDQVARVLIVNADSVYSMTLGFALTGRKHSVEVARSGSQGLEIGFQIRPDLVIVDWMLAGDLDGLQVAEALRATLDRPRTMMVTDFPPDDLRSEATGRGISKFLEKSIATEELLEHVDETLESDPPPEPLSLGYIQYEENGRGSYANATFRKMFGMAPNGSEGGLVERVFSSSTRNDLLRSKDGWLELKNRGASSAGFLGYVRRAEDGRRSLFVLPRKDEELKDHPIVRTILGRKEPPAIPGRVLVIDENELQSRLARNQLEKSGGRCHTARSMDVAVRILAADPEAQVALLDFRTAKELNTAVRELTEVRPKLTIVGMCTAFRKREFEAAGVTSFLVKPVVATVLFRLLATTSA